MDHWRWMQSCMSLKEMLRSRPMLTSAPASPCIEYVRDGALGTQHAPSLTKYSSIRPHACVRNSLLPGRN